MKIRYFYILNRVLMQKIWQYSVLEHEDQKNQKRSIAEIVFFL